MELNTKLILDELAQRHVFVKVTHLAPSPNLHSHLTTPCSPPFAVPSHSSSSGHLCKLQFPKFDGVNPCLWHSCGEKYFAMFRMEVSLLSHGDALSWFSCPLVVVVGVEDASYQLVYLLLFPA